MEVPKTRWAKTVDGTYIAYQDFGEGPDTLVVIHGWVTHLEVYWEQPRFARFMRRLANSMRVLNFDKRGTGMSDRVTGAPNLEARMDDLRAVMDAAGVERAAVYGWGRGASELAVLFAATYPERVAALCIDGGVRERWAPDYPWGLTEEDEEAELALASAWGDEDHVIELLQLFSLGDAIDAPEFLRWSAKFFRFAATPGSYEAFERMWLDTDVRDVLPAVHVPFLVLYKTREDDRWRDEETYVAERVPGARLTCVPGTAGVPWVEEPELYVSAIERFLASVREEEAELDRVLATVMFTDIVGSTEKASELGDHGWRELVQRHHATVRALLDRYRGREMDTAGDGFFASFDGPARAIRCALAITDAVRPLGLEIRAGLHTGEVETIDAKVGGIAVSIGARVAALAGPSEVLVSQTVKDLVAGSGLSFEDRGERELKGVPDRWHLYRVVSGPT